ncbi:MAG: DUF4245 domain-containing protein [Microbacteriaceae bacterium]
MQIFTEPETPEEIAALKAENTRKRRVNNTGFNLVIAIVATLAAVAVLWMTVLRPSGSIVPEIDYATAVLNAERGYSEDIVAPELPEGWTLNAANVRTDQSDKQLYWYLGIVTADEQFIALNQRIDADESWTIRMMDSTLPSGDITLAGKSWIEFDRRNNDKASGNKPYGIALTEGSSTVLLHGTASPEDFERLAQLVVAELNN